MIWTRQITALAAAMLPVVSHAGILRDVPGRADLFAGHGAPLPSIPVNHHVKRQAAGGFLDSDPASPTKPTCDQASMFGLNGLGQLQVGGEVISTNPGTPFIPLRPISPPGSISVAFSITNGALSWFHPGFFGGQAGFCQNTAGQVFATFADPAVAYPSNCVPVRLGSLLASTCPTTASGGPPGVTPSSIGIPAGPTVTTIGTTTVSGFVTTLSGLNVAPTAVNSELTLRSGLYTESGFVTPAGSTCRVVTESWMFGDTTLLPPRTTSVS